MSELTNEILRKVVKKRPKNSHKGTFGRFLLVGGNPQYGGAAILAASAAVYSGAGLVSVATAVCNHAALHARLPEAMVIDWSDDFETEKYDVIVIGCGLGLERHDLLAKVLTNQAKNQKIVIDGSAIQLFAEHDFALKFPENTIFTPHQMELQRLSGLEIKEQTEPAIQDFVNDLGATVVAKSSETKLFTPRKEFQVLKIGSPAQATGGMGDTLAGMIGGFLAQFHRDEAIAAATYLHSCIAANLAKTQYVVLPSQIISEIPHYMKKFENSIVS